jgi:hypothetical protein
VPDNKEFFRDVGIRSFNARCGVLDRSSTQDGEHNFVCHKSRAKSSKQRLAFLCDVRAYVDAERNWNFNFENVVFRILLRVDINRLFDEPLEGLLDSVRQRD